MTDLIEKIANAIATKGFGCEWDDFLEVNAHDTDQSDLLDYAAAALSAIRENAGDLVEPLDFKNSYGVMRADTSICSYIVTGKFVSVRKMNYEMVASEDQVQAHHTARVLRLLNLEGE